MKSLEVKCNLRETTGKKNSKKLRKQGMVPCVLYGGGENVHFLAPENDFRHLVYTPNAYLVKLDIDGKEYKCVLHEIQFHPVSDKILHMDFYQVFDDKYVSMQVPVQLNGVPEGVKQGGKLSLESRRIKARALPGDLPDVLVIDVSKIGLGKSIKVNELNFPGIQLLDSPNTVIASVKLTRAARGLTVEEEAAEAEAEAAAEAAETEDAASASEGGGTSEGGDDQKQG
jgi:large subunit ribosomal protein L25